MVPPDALGAENLRAVAVFGQIATLPGGTDPWRRILRMSGGQVTVLGPEGGQFISKPFTAKDLVERVRAILDVPAEY